MVIGGWLGVEGGFDGESAALEDVGVDHGGFDVFMPKEFLNGPYVIAGLEEMGGKRVAEGVGADSFCYVCLFGGLFDGFLEG